jgi:hypothetical protein
MDGLIVIRSMTLSNNITKAQFLEAVLASYFRVLAGRGRDNTITLRARRKAIKSQYWSDELETIIHKISFQRTPKMILKYY